MQISRLEMWLSILAGSAGVWMGLSYYAARHPVPFVDRTSGMSPDQIKAAQQQAAQQQGA